MALPRLRHIHLPGPISYATASTLQEVLVSRFLASKRNATTTPAPSPHLITTSFTPTYTCGRREIGTVSAEQQAFLRAGGKASFVEAKRGGQTTFHGPGQMIGYPVLDLRAHGLSARSYVCVLEKSLIALCARYGIQAFTTEHTGVWVSDEDKIAALGVHMRRNVTSHGVGLNVDTKLWWFERIVACGLVGKRTTSFRELGVEVEGGLEEVSGVFAEEMAGRLEGVEGVEMVGQEEVEELMREGREAEGSG